MRDDHAGLDALAKDPKAAGLLKNRQLLQDLAASPDAQALMGLLNREAGGGPGELALWSFRLSFRHPATGEALTFARLPQGVLWDDLLPAANALFFSEAGKFLPKASDFILK